MRRTTKTKARSGRGRSSHAHRREPDALSSTIGARIRAIREGLDLSFLQLVERTKLGAGYISELERGLVMPSAGTLSRVAGALDVTVADLVVGDSERERLFSDLRQASPALVRRVRAFLERELKKKTTVKR